MKYFRQYHDEAVAEEVTREEALRSIAAGYAYNLPGLVLEGQHAGQKINTRNCMVWKEES